MERWRGLKSLIVDAVDHGSRAVEKIQKDTARWPFAALESIPPIAVPAKGIHEIHDAAVTGVHEMIRLVNRVAGQTLDVVIDAVAEGRAAAGRPEDPPPGPPS